MTKYFKDLDLEERKDTVPLFKQMVRFISPHGDEFSERIIIRNLDELYSYAKLRENMVLYNGLERILSDKEYNAGELMNMNESPEMRTIKLFHRDNDLLTATKKAVLAPIFPMMEQINKGKTVIVNEAGGWSYLEDGNTEIASDEITEVIGAKITWGSNKYLVLENSASISDDLRSILLEENIDSPTEICYLKMMGAEKLSNMLFKMENDGLEEIILETNFQDSKQSESMIRLIESLPKLTIRILTASDRQLQSKHRIIKYDYMRKFTNQDKN